MSDQTKTDSIFSGRGVAFEQILFSGALGGPQALQTYLQTRTAQIGRQLSQPSRDPDEEAGLIRALQAFEGAVRLLPGIAAPRRASGTAARKDRVAP